MTPENSALVGGGVEQTAPSPDVFRRPGRWRRGWRIVHRMLGLAFALQLIVASWSGAILVLRSEVTGWEERRIAPRQTSTERVPLNNILASVRAIAPASVNILYVVPDPDPGRVLRLQLRDGTHPGTFGTNPGRAMQAYVDPATGALLALRDETDFIVGWARWLHFSLHAGGAGIALVVAGGVALIALSVSGLGLAWQTTRQFWSLKFRSGLRSSLAGAHRMIALAGIPMLFLWGSTGVFMATTAWLERSDAPELLPPMLPATALPVLESLMSAARGHFPGAEVRSIRLPQQGGEPVSVFLVQRAAPVWRKFARVDFASDTGELVRVQRPGGGFWNGVRASVTPLHFGIYGDGRTRAFYAAAALLPTVLGTSGIAIWWLGRRRTVPRAESCPEQKYLASSHRNS